MKTNRFLFAVAFAAITFTFFACSSDEPTPPGGDNPPENGGNQTPSSSSEPPPPYDKYCDYGPITIYGGGCFEMENADDCDLQWGKVVDVCPTYNSSSSSAPRPSSSSVVSISSSSLASQGTFTDSRDNRTYKWVKIGTQTWMAENLLYTNIGACYDNSLANCTKYGGLYSWVEALGLPSSCNESSGTNCYDQISANHKGVCPDGWHIPNLRDWNTLKTYVESNKGCTNCAGNHLKSKSGWNWNDWDRKSGNGLDSYGFSALPAGYGSIISTYSSFNLIGERTYFQIADATLVGYAYDSCVEMRHDSDSGSYGDDCRGLKSDNISVRCIKN